jgi:hypothetical protein
MPACICHKTKSYPVSPNITMSRTATKKRNSIEPPAQAVDFRQAGGFPNQARHAISRG